jgi:class 3 adenylate cyclase
MHHSPSSATRSVAGAGSKSDTAGDGFYATFDGPSRAIRSAMEIVDGVRDLGIEIRAGVHTVSTR